MNRINSINIPASVDKVIKNYIQSFEGSNKLQNMTYGEDYYRSKNTAIKNRRMLIYTEDDKGCPYEIDDPYKSNNKLASGYLKTIIDQKVNYSLGKDIVLESSNNDELWDLLGKNFQTTLKTIGKESAKKSVGWGHVYLDLEGKLKLIKIPSEQIIPVYSDMDDEELEIIIRYYKVVAQDEKGNIANVIRVEVWDSEQVTYYQEHIKSHCFYMLNDTEMCKIFHRPVTNPRFHLSKSTKFGKKIERTEGQAWGEIPFIPLYNNDEEMTDLEPIKNYIDVFDVVESDFANNLEDFQDLYWILRGYNGENVGQFLENVKRYKSIKIDGDGDAKAERLEVPHEARMVELKNLEEKIFVFGQGVNLNQTGDGNITNVVIRSRFANLDLKASQFETEIEDFINKLMYFVNKYREMNNMQAIELEKIVFDRSMIVNEVEMLESNTKQKGLISEDTRLGKHPWVDDIDAEKKAMENERAEYVPLLDEVGDEDELGAEGEATNTENG